MALHKRVLNFPKEISDALALFVEIASPFGVMDHALLGAALSWPPVGSTV